MTKMTEEQKLEQAEQVLELLVDQADKAHSEGREQLHNFLTSTAFTVGSLMAINVTSKGLGPMTNLMIEHLIAGIEAGVQQSDLPGTFTVVRRSL